MWTRSPPRNPRDVANRILAFRKRLILAFHNSLFSSKYQQFKSIYIKIHNKKTRGNHVPSSSSPASSRPHTSLPTITANPSSARPKTPESRAYFEPCQSFP